MNLKEFKYLVKDGETSTCEFKESFNDAVIETLVAFSNSKGGKVFIGVSNKQIAEIFKEAGIIEKYGSGIKRIIESFEREDLLTPKFEEFSGGFRVTIYNSKQSLEKKRWSETLKLIYKLITENPNISRKELSLRTGVSQSAIQKHMDKLKRIAVITRIGGAKSGYWRVLKK